MDSPRVAAAGVVGCLLALATITVAASQSSAHHLGFHILHQSAQHRDGHRQSGMEPGMYETLNRLNEVLTSMEALSA